jgi:hypothetical protein
MNNNYLNDKMMKTKRLGLFMLCLLFTGLSLEIRAQAHLDALIKKCETHKSVDMEVVKNKRIASENVEIKSVNIRITNDRNLVNDFLEAFKKDAVDAVQVMIRKKDGSQEVHYYQCQFADQTYTIVVKENANANVTVGSSATREKQRAEQQKQRVEQQKKRMKQQAKQHKERMKQHQKRMKLHLDSTIIRHNIIADSLILKSTGYLNAINWDSISSKFIMDMDTLVNRMGSIRWDEVLEKYEFE